MNEPNADAIRQTVVDVIASIAPEADLTRVDAKRSLREQLDLDSFDFLNLMIELHARLGIDVPEADYGKVDSLHRLLAYLAQHHAGP